MKQTLVILLATLFWMCSSDNELTGTETADKLELSKSEVKLANHEGSFTINVTATGDWTAEVSGVDGGWLTLSKTNGSKSGDLRLFFTENTDGGKRAGKIKVKMQVGNTTLEEEITVEQLGSDPDILIDYSKEVIPFTGTVLVCQVVSNIDWEVIIDEQCNWIETDHLKATGRSMTTEDVRFNISANIGAERKGEIVIKAKGGYALKRIVAVTQEAVKNTMKVEQDEYIIPYKCKTLSIPVVQEHAIEYSILAESWITLDKEASTDDAIVLKIEDNTDFLPRTSIVTVKNSVMEQTVEIFQYGKPDTSIGDDPSAGQLLAFPGAEGGGRFTTGGRGGEIYRVTNLKDYAKNETPIQGSLRYGIEKSDQPRTIIFDVSGIIELTRGLFLVDKPNVSIIGQTAPGDGITLKNYNFSFNLSQNSKEMNAIIRFLRCRPGDKYEDYAEDGIGGRYFTNAIVDHVTASWGVDETFSFYGVQNFTAQWCMATESLNFSNHAKGAHGYGSMFSGDNASFHHILMAHHGSRCPRISDMPEPGTQGAGDHIGFFDVRNNVYYNWSEAGFGSYGGKYGTFNIANCYYKAGPATGTGSMSWRVLSSDPTARAYIEGNYMTTSAEVTADNWTNGVWSQFWRDLNPTQEEMRAMKMATPQPFSKVTNHSAEQAYEKVLAYAGASLRRDAIDQRIVNEVRTKTSTYTGSKDATPRPGIIDTVGDTEGYPVVKSLKPWPDTDGDGIPDIWEIAYGLDPNDPSDAAKISTSVDANGRYSNLEVYFHNLVQHIVYHQNQGGQAIEQK